MTPWAAGTALADALTLVAGRFELKVAATVHDMRVILEQVKPGVISFGRSTRISGEERRIGSIRYIRHQVIAIWMVPWGVNQDIGQTWDADLQAWTMMDDLTAPWAATPTEVQRRLAGLDLSDFEVQIQPSGPHSGTFVTMKFTASHQWEHGEAQT